MSNIYNACVHLDGTINTYGDLLAKALADSALDAIIDANTVIFQEDSQGIRTRRQYSEILSNFKCAQCGREYGTIYALKYHINTRH